MPNDVVIVNQTVLDAIDRIVKKAGKISPNGHIETKKDWDLVKDLYFYWRTLFPENYAWFIDEITLIKEAHSKNKGIIHEEDGASMQHTMELPSKLWDLIHETFPKQDMDAEFVKGLIKILPEFEAK